MRKTLPLLVMITLLTVSAIPAPAAPGESEDGIAEWTFIVYLAAGNNLEGAGIRDMNQMELVGSDENLNIVILFDRIEGYDSSEGDWTGTRIYHVQHNPDSDNLGTYEEGVNVWYSIDEIDLNMGDPQTLINFTTWTIDNFPAKKYALDMWNHGAGWWGICWDDAYEDYLNMTELSDGLEAITEHLGRRLDLVGFDACLMAQTAVMYEIKDYADIGVGSGLVEPGPGWPYDRILRPLADNPQMSGRDLGKIIVDEYVESYTNQEDDPDDSIFATMAAFDLAKMEDAAEAISRFGMAMSTGSGLSTPGAAGAHYSKLRYIRSRTASYDMANVGPFDLTRYCLYDIIDFADRVERDPQLGYLHSHAQYAKLMVRETMYHSKSNDFRINHHGMTVYFPSGTQTQYNQRFDQTRYAQDRYWATFLQNFETNSLVANTPPSVTITTPRGSESFPAGQSHITVTGTAFDLQNTVVSVEIRLEGGEWAAISGNDVWEYKLELDGSSGPTTVYVRAFDGELYSPEVSRTFFVGEGPVEAPSDVRGRGGAWVLLIIPLVAAVAYVIYKKELLSIS